MIRARLTALTFFIAASASAHTLVDVGMSIDAPRFVATQQTFTYHVIADDRNNDNGSGIVITIVLPPTSHAPQPSRRIRLDPRIVPTRIATKVVPQFRRNA